MSVTTQAHPAALASKSEIERPSERLGSTYMSVALRISGILSLKPKNRTLFVNPFSLTSLLSSASSGPDPTIRATKSSSINDSASIRYETPLTLSNLPTKVITATSFLRPRFFLVFVLEIPSNLSIFIPNGMTLQFFAFPPNSINLFFGFTVREIVNSTF